MPCYPHWSPEPVIYDGTIEIDGFDDVVFSIQVRVTYHLNRHRVVLLAFHIDGGHVLVDVLCQNGLQDNQAVLAFTDLDDAEIVHIAVAVQVKVVQMAFF